MAENAARAETTSDAPTQPVVVKKYANRRLYNTESSSYVTLEDLANMVRQGRDFIVFDAKSGEDITRSVLTQIIFEEESQGQSLLPIQFLRQLIGFYGNSMQAFLPSYLEMSLNSFTQQQEQFRQQFAAGQFPALKPGGGYLEDQVRQNMAMFDRAMKMFSPFGFAAAATGRPEPAAPAPPAEAKGGDDAIDDLKKQMAAMQAQIERLAKN